MPELLARGWPLIFDSTSEFTFNADHSLVCSGESLGQHAVFFKGTWLLDGKRILIREEDKLHIMNIDDLRPGELWIRESEGRIVTYKRIK